MRKQLRRATERYGSIISKMSSYDLSQSLAEETSQVLGKSVNQLLKQKSCPEIALKLDSIPKINGWKTCGTCHASPRLERVSSNQGCSEVALSNIIDREHQENSERKSLAEVKRPEANVIPEDFRCPISLELMRDPVIVATGQV